jgi:hypothetical protein
MEMCGWVSSQFFSTNMSQLLQLLTFLMQTKALTGIFIMNMLIRVEYTVDSLIWGQGDKGEMEMCGRMS